MQHQVEAWNAQIRDGAQRRPRGRAGVQGGKGACSSADSPTGWPARVDLSTKMTDEMVGDAGVALDWKWTYGDGELATWRTGDIAEFLLEWCPRKLSVTQADCVTIPVALVSYFSFLDEEELLGPGSAPLDRLIEAVTVLAEEFVEAMGDRSNFGLAKSMFTAASDEGVDLSDPDEAQAWMERFNDRSEEERHRLLPDSAFAAPPHRPSLPPVAVPGDDEVAASREAAPILAMFRDFAAYMGTGRKLTQKGNLTLADARALVDLLGTGDLMERTIRDHTFRTTSSDNLYHLRQMFAWAKKAGVVRVVHGKVVATKQGLGLADGLAGSFDRAVDALMAIGPLSSQRFPDNWFAWPEVDHVLDNLSAHLLIAPYGAQSAFPLEDIAATATGVVLDAFSFQMDDDRVAQTGGHRCQRHHGRLRTGRRPPPDRHHRSGRQPTEVGGIGGAHPGGCRLRPSAAGRGRLRDPHGRPIRRRQRLGTPPGYRRGGLPRRLRRGDGVAGCSPTRGGRRRAGRRGAEPRRPGAGQSGPGHHGGDRCGRGRTVRPSVGVGTWSSGIRPVLVGRRRPGRRG